MTEFEFLKLIYKSRNKNIDYDTLEKLTHLPAWEFRTLFYDYKKSDYMSVATYDLQHGEMINKTYKISGFGIDRYNELRKLSITNFWLEVRNWLAIIIAIAAFIKSFFY